jgi:hypothetical protein
MMRKAFVVGVEGRYLPPTSVTAGEDVKIPAHWTAVAVLGGLDERGVPRMWAAQAPYVSSDDTLVSARDVINATMRDFPVDGGTLRVQGRHVFGVAGAPAPLRQYHLWVPPRDVFETAGRVVVEGRLVGGGIGLEWDAERGRLHLAPYLAARVFEETESGRRTSIVVPVRWMAPGCEEGVLAADDAPLSEAVPLLHERIRRHSIGARVVLEVLDAPAPHYSLLEVHEDTELGLALSGAGLVDPSRPMVELRAELGT